MKLTITPVGNISIFY